MEQAPRTFPGAMRKGCTLVSGIALGPDFASRRRASSLVKRRKRLFWASADLAGVLPVVGSEKRTVSGFWPTNNARFIMIVSLDN